MERVSPPLLLTPGPVAVPDFIIQAISQPVIPHRSEAFYTFYAGLLQDLQYLFQTEGSTCCMMGSGTYGVEAAMYSLFKPGDNIFVVSMGKFSQRWVDYGKLLGLEVIEWKLPWGACPDPQSLKERLRSYTQLQGIIFTHCETSTGVGMDLESCAYEFRTLFPNALILVDGITSVGVLPFYVDAWDLDCAVVASQKALMNPAGVCAIGLSKRGKMALRKTQLADFRNLYNYVSFAEKGSFPYTPPVQLLFGIQAALNYIKEQELPVIWNQVHHTAQYFRRGLEELGGEIVGAVPADSLTAFSLSRDLNVLKNFLEVEQQVLISGGQGELAGKILRVSHMGLTGIQEMDTVLQSIRKFLAEPNASPALL